MLRPERLELLRSMRDNRAMDLTLIGTETEWAASLTGDAERDAERDPKPQTFASSITYGRETQGRKVVSETYSLPKARHIGDR